MTAPTLVRFESASFAGQELHEFLGIHDARLFHRCVEINKNVERGSLYPGHIGMQSWLSFILSSKEIHLFQSVRPLPDSADDIRTRALALGGCCRRSSWPSSRTRSGASSRRPPSR